MRFSIRPPVLLLCFGLCLSLLPAALAAQQQTDEEEAPAVETAEAIDPVERQERFDELVAAEESTARGEEAALNEDPEAQRRSRIEEAPELRSLWPNFDFYASVRLHAINNFNEEQELTEFNLGDGASRMGVRAEWQMTKRWWVFGRAESGFDVLDTFTPKAGDDDKEELGLTKRLLYGGFDSENLTVAWGKNWSAYYKIAGMADRFSIFGGSGVGVYNAGTDGGATGTGRANDVIQARIYTSSLRAFRIKPFNLNLQYQYGRPIPRVEGRHYGQAWGASAWLETQGDRGLGVATHRAAIDNPEDSLVRAAGIDGDARAIALAVRTYGERWYAAFVYAWLDNIETTDQFRYVNGRGAELYAQWEFRDRWWLVGGGNWFNPESDDPEAGHYKTAYGVIGLRYTFDSFNRMVYAEYRIDNGRLFDGTPRRNELTLGIRWDFGH